MASDEEVTDVLVIGGGPAGLTAALYLGRARNSVIVVDRGNPRHAVSEGVHNFLTRDGMLPADLRVAAWEQMAPYATVTRRDTAVSTLERRGERWFASTDDGTTIAADAVLLATGLVDEHPPLPGYSERWGRSVHQCPFCHGWEARDQALAVLAHGAAAGPYVLLLRNWSRDLVLLTHGQGIPDETRDLVSNAGVPIYDSPIEALEGSGAALERIRLVDGATIDRQGLFVKTVQRQVDLVSELGVALDDHGFVEIDPFGATSLPMVWAAGDSTSGHQQVVEAAAQGARAAVMIIRSFALLSATRDRRSDQQ